MTKKIAEIESKYVNNIGFDSKLAQANVISKRNFDAKIIELENNIKNYKHLIRAILEVNIILMKMLNKIYLVLLLISIYFRIIVNTKYISS